MVDSICDTVRCFQKEYKSIYEDVVVNYLLSESHKACTLAGQVFNPESSSVEMSSVVKSLKKLKSSLDYSMNYNHPLYKLKEEDFESISVSKSLLQDCILRLSSVDFKSIRIIAEGCVKRLVECVDTHSRIWDAGRYSTLHQDFVRYNIIINYSRLVSLFYPLCMLVNLEDNIKQHSPGTIANTVSEFLTDLSWIELINYITDFGLTSDVDTHIETMYLIEGKGSKIGEILQDSGAPNPAITLSNDYMYKVATSKFNLVKLLCDIYSYD